MQDGEFEWDDAKARENLTRHGVSFEQARLAFDDPFGVAREDRRRHYGEDRYTLIGIAWEHLVFVAYTHRGERVRILSARLAQPFERRLYHEANNN
jgi:uncharacterized DUF497 family protein